MFDIDSETFHVSHGHHHHAQSVRPYAESQVHIAEARRRQQIEALAQLDCLHAVPHDDLARLADIGVLRAVVAGTLIVNERIPCNFVYLILRGTASLSLHDRSGHEVLISVLNRGDCFGEGPLFGDLFRGACVQAETRCYLLQIPRSDLQAILSNAPELTAALRSRYRQRMVESTLGRVPVLGQLAPVERMQLAELLQPEHYERGTVIIHKGMLGQALYLIEAGQVVVEQDGQAIAHLDEGDFFGEMSLLSQVAHNADVRALTPVDVLALSATEFNKLLQRRPELKAQMHDVVNQRLGTRATMQQDHERIHQLTAAVDRGLLRGTHILVRDLQLCSTGCQICADACATRHGQTRIQLNGVLLDRLDITSSCRQCRVGAECVEACPVDAIQWNESGALVITEQCTGCGACVSACPYDAVTMVNTDSASQSPLWSLWQRLKHLHHPTIPLQAVQPSQRADKCDLCNGYSDLACVVACPNGALHLVPVEELFPF